MRKRKTERYCKNKTAREKEEVAKKVQEKKSEI